MLKKEAAGWEGPAAENCVIVTNLCICSKNNSYGRIIIIIIIIVTQGRVVNGERRHAEPQGGNDHPQLAEELLLLDLYMWFDRLWVAGILNGLLNHFR
jgi:hypothetical protein